MLTQRKGKLIIFKASDMLVSFELKRKKYHIVQACLGTYDYADELDHHTFNTEAEARAFALGWMCGVEDI